MAKKLASSPLLCASGLLALVLCSASPLLYHADNLTFCHALYLNDTASPHWLHPSYLLSCLLCAVAPLVPWVNVYLLYLYALLVGSAAAVLRVTRETEGDAGTLRVAGVVVACYILAEIPMRLEYAWVSFLAAGCGCMLLFHRMYRRETSWNKLLPGLLLAAGGAVLRYDSCPGFMLFIGVATLFCRIRNGRSGPNVRSLALPAALVAFLACVYLLQPLAAERHCLGEDNVVEVNQVRMAVCDYPDRSGLDKTAAYRAADVSPACLEMVRNYFCCDEMRMNGDWWERLGHIRRDSNPEYEWSGAAWSRAGELIALCHNRFLVLLFLALWGVWIRRGKWRLYPLAMLLVYGLGIILCCAKGRCNLTPIMSLAYFYVPMLLIPCGVQEKLPRCISRRFAAGAAWAAALAVLAGIAVVNHDRLLPFGGFRHHYGEPAVRTALVEWMQRHPDCNVLADCYVYRTLAYPDAPLLRPKTPYIPRLIELGNWPSTLPYRHRQRLCCGIDNETLSLSQSSTRLLLGPSELDFICFPLAYIRECYGIDLVPQKEYTLPNGYAIYSLVRPDPR